MVESKVILCVVSIQTIYAGNFLLTKLAFDVGMNTFVFVFYRQAAATLFLAPIAIFFERKTAPRLSFSTFIKIFFLSLFGITMSLDVVGVGLKSTTASLGAAISNSLPVITFFLAVLLRMEKVKIRTSPGMMKMIGVSLCMGGVAAIAFYRGPFIKLWHLHHIHTTFHSQITPTNTWIKGVFLLLLSNTTWASWLLFQGRVLNIYPSKLLLTTLQCFLSTIQSFVAAVAFARDPAHWKIGWNIRLLSVAYCGIIVTGVTFYMQAWVIEKRGPVFLAMTTPLITLITLLISVFVLGETVTLGSVLGAVLLVGGLYFVLWGKTKEEQRAKMACHPNLDQEKPCEESSPEIIN
ncbi:WAT1-related protein At5g64700-like isoform X2 [Salvia miltiorrhiza]|uniref:WAT1-related protein At5g64700-like isoform X2 n=1 Tax=Salvia miltiorrhiza TaxID=226208 RepID=UPI0025AD0D0C|nr:WAT1-related protein At5g64700-like isoform X2 [Salvia miltiorrhiza]